MKTIETDLKVGDKVKLHDADDFVLPKFDTTKASEGKEDKKIEAYKDSIEAVKNGKNHYVVIEISEKYIHCRNEAIPKFRSKRNMFYGKNDLHLIEKVK